jgi:hypothetical protein
VRSLRARVDELSKQLDKLGGDSIGPTPALAGSGRSLPDGEAPARAFPSIRQLPLLGVRWADLYRQTKIEETVYELLTQQYELAKIQEAKEIPTVKILDAADVPEKKASPHRGTIMILGMLLALSAGAVWVLSAATWEKIDPQDPRRQLGQEVGHRVKAFCKHCHEKRRRLIGRWSAA